MTGGRERPDVVLLDPGSFTPYYDLNLAHALAERGWRVEVSTSPHLFEPVQSPQGVDVRHDFFGALERPAAARWARRRAASRLRQAYKGLAYPAGLVRVGRRLERRPPGILHVQWSHLPGLDVTLWRRLRRRGWRVIYTVHEVTPVAAPDPPLYEQLYRVLPEVADRVIVHSVSESRSLEAHGVPAERVRVIPQGDLGLFGHPALSREDARAALGLPDRPTLLFFGLLKGYKGLDVLLRSLPEVLRARPDALLVVAGERMEATAPARPEALDGAVLWREGYVPTTAVGVYLAAADVVVIPYRRSSSSAVLPAALAHGTPVVATSVGGLPEMVQPGKTGLLVPPDDPGTLAQAVVELLSDPAKARFMGDEARRVASKRHAWTAIAARTEQLYSEALG